jgi:predicted house-cleaning noncanonical NTP pyrophosphatase (MazG superfamily)
MDTDGKLVRDRIPEIIEASGRQPTTRVLSQAERLPALLLKLQEESDELRDATTVADQAEEIADVLEVLKGIASELGQPWPNIETLADDKRARRGGFEAGMWLQAD